MEGDHTSDMCDTSDTLACKVRQDEVLKHHQQFHASRVETENTDLPGTSTWCDVLASPVGLFVYHGTMQSIARPLIILFIIPNITSLPPFLVALQCPGNRPLVSSALFGSGRKLRARSAPVDRVDKLELACCELQKSQGAKR